MRTDVNAASLSEKPKGPGKTPRETYNSFKLTSKVQATASLPMQTEAMAGILVLVTSRAHEELTRVKLQVRQTDQVWYRHQLQVSSLAGDLQWCSCPLRKNEKHNQYNPSGSL